MALPNPIDTFTRGLNKWWVWLLIIILFILWLIRIDRDMKNRTGQGLFDDLWGDWFN